MAPLAPVPFTNVLMNLRSRLMEFQWVRWLESLVTAINAAPQAVGTSDLSDQDASVSATAFDTGTLSAGLYRVSYYQRVTQAATSSSSLTTAIGWTDGGVACTQSGAAMTGNTTATTQNGTLVVHVDAGTTVTYALTYSTSGATPMQFSWSGRLEQLA